MIDDHSVVQLAGHSHEVLVFPAGGMLGRSGHRRVRAVGNPRSQIEIVCGEILYHSDIVNPGRERGLAHSGDLVDLPEQAFLNLLPQSADRRVATLDVADGTDHVFLRGEISEFLSFRNGCSQGLFDEHVNTVLNELLRHIVMLGRRYGNHNRIHTSCNHVVNILVQRRVASDPEFVAKRVCQGDELGSFEGSDIADVVPPHRAKTDNCVPQVRHYAPAFPTALTASTIRSRSSWERLGCTGRDRHCLAYCSVRGSSTPSAK